MTYEDHLYHADRAEQCREWARRSADPEISRRHDELAQLHAERAASYAQMPGVAAA